MKETKACEFGSKSIDRFTSNTELFLRIDTLLNHMIVLVAAVEMHVRFEDVGNIVIQNEHLSFISPPIQH